METTRSPTAGDCSQLLGEYAPKKALAKAFGVCERTIERWVRLRLLPAPLRLGRTSLHHLPTVKQHLAEQTEAKGRRRARSFA